MSQARLNLFIQPDHAKRLDELATKKGVSRHSPTTRITVSHLNGNMLRGVI